MGTPLETRETIRETLDLVREIDPPFLTLARFAPIPGTEMYQELEGRGLISADADWSMECNQRLSSHYIYGMSEDEFGEALREVTDFVEAHNRSNCERIGTRDGRLM